ncbi:Hypothetical predicted protein [Pelobates cultripes]|uniref:Uncharacterized protein n=1 Tax=Pelobates cultripes TaxID=61616 RepID=A0AAD1WDB7_PELCU|nr:Hypothetical predicted protein [Pelobates cultripes]
MGGNKKRKDMQPSVATIFLARENGRPSLSEYPPKSGSDSEDGKAQGDPTAPLTMGNLKRLLHETSAYIKAHTAPELEKQITGLKEDLEALTSRTNKAKTQIVGLTQKSEAHQQELVSKKSSRPFSQMPQNTIERAHRALRPFAKFDQPKVHYHENATFTGQGEVDVYRKRQSTFTSGPSYKFLPRLGSFNITQTEGTQTPHNGIVEPMAEIHTGHPFKLVVKRDNQTYTLHQPTDMQDFVNHIGITLIHEPLPEVTNPPRGYGHRPGSRPLLPQQARKRPTSTLRGLHQGNTRTRSRGSWTLST